jgi:FxsC-like protein
VFFLSYAHADANPFFEKFLKALLEDVRGQLGGTDVKNLYFRDSESMDLGDVWKPSIEDALRRCSCFVPILSPTYVQRPMCGYEWAAIERRITASSNAGTRPPAIVPVYWQSIPHDLLPEAIAVRQFGHRDLGEGYAREGMQYLMRTRGREKPIIELAKRIVAAERRRPDEATDVVQPRDLQPAFGAPVPVREDTVRPGPKNVDFIIVAGRTEQLRGKRENLGDYGTDPDDWSPYKPEVKRLAVELQALASSEGMTSTITAVPSDMVKHVEAAIARNNVIVIVIDLWMFDADDYDRVMEAYTLFSKDHCAAMVIWNSRDVESNARKQELERKLRRIFREANTRWDPTTFRWDIDSLQEFRIHLRRSIVTVQQRIVRRPAVSSARAMGVGLAAPPRVTGPGEP